MTETYFEKELDEKCFSYGQGASYFKESYFETKNGTEEGLLKNICLNIKNDFKNSMGCASRELVGAFEIMKMSIETVEQQLEFINRYYGECSKDFPKSTGAIVGALAKQGKYQLAYDLLELETMKEGAYIPWNL
jgi:hypothetical protein